MANKLIIKALAGGFIAMTAAGGSLRAENPDHSMLPSLISPMADGYLKRAETFASDGNWEAVSDQLRMLSDQNLPLPDAVKAECLFLNILASYHTGAFDTPQLVDYFAAEHPSDPRIAEAMVIKGNFYFYRGAYAEALRVYQELDEGGVPESMKSLYYYNKALSMIKCGYYTQAQRLLEKLKKDREYRDAAYFYDAYIDYVNKDYNSAYQKFEQVGPTSEKGLESEFYLTQLDYQRGDYRKVIEEGEELLFEDIDPVLLPETLKVVGLSYFKTGDTAKAAPLLEQYIELADDSADRNARYAMATIYYDRGDFDKAIPLFESVTDDSDAVTQSSWLYLGQIAQAQNNGQQAAIYFSLASEKPYNHEVAETALYNLAVTAVSGTTVPFGSNVEILEKFVDTYPDSKYVPTVSSYLASSYFNAKNYEKALASIEKIKNPSQEVKQARQKILYELGMKQLAAGETDKAINSLKDAAAGTGLNAKIAAQAYVWLGDAYYSKKDYKEAEKAYSAGLATKETDANTAIAEYNLGYSMMKLKDYKGALEHFRLSLESKGLTTSQTTDARLRIADCLYYLGHHNEALKDFSEIATMSGQESVYAAMRKAELVGRQGELASKIEILEELEDGEMGIWSQEILSSLADAYNETGNDVEAARLNARIFDTATTESEAMQALYSLAENADNLYEKGDRENAGIAYRKLLDSEVPDFYNTAITGLMRTSGADSEILEYAETLLSTPGVSPDLSEEARYRIAEVNLRSHDDPKVAEALESLKELAETPSRDWGGRASLLLAQYYIDEDDPELAEKILIEFTDSDTDNQYLLALGYIKLADAYIAQNNSYLAKLYLETLRDNYPGKEREITDMINSRLKSLK